MVKPDTSFRYPPSPLMQQYMEEEQVISVHRQIMEEYEAIRTHQTKIEELSQRHWAI